MKKGLKSSKYGRYLMTQKQMSEARHIEAVFNAKVKRGEIRDFGLYQCGCGCGVFGAGKNDR